MCILPELDLILGALPRGPYVRFTLSPPYSYVPFLFFFSVEQTETELPLVEPLLPPRLAASWRDHVRICVAGWSCSLCFSRNCGDVGEALCMWNTEGEKEQVQPSKLVLMHAYVFHVQVCVEAYVSTFACLFMPGGEGGDCRCTCCHRAVISLAEFSWIITLPPLAPHASKHWWDETKQWFVAGLSETPHPALSGVRWRGNSRLHNRQNFSRSVHIKA